MTVKNLLENSSFTALCTPNPDREIEGVYAGDLLSWVMGRLNEGSVWVTIMSNVNIVAVATLVDAACIVLAEGVNPDPDALSAAEAKGINIISTPLSAYEAAVAVSNLIK